MALPQEELRMLETQMFGRTVHWPYSEHWFGWSVFVLRLVIGWTMFWAGIDKLVEPLRGNPKWTASGFLEHAIPEGNPFAGMFANMSGPAIDFLVPWGLLLTGICLLFGFLTRFAAFWAFIMMGFFWLASWEGWFKLEHGWVVDDHVVYMVLLFGLGAFGAGRILGVDRKIETMAWFRKNRWLGWFFG